MSEITAEEKQRIIDKWKHVLDYDPNDTTCKTVILIEGQERIHTKEEVEAATPDKVL
jgi:hypothetical protein